MSSHRARPFALAILVLAASLYSQAACLLPIAVSTAPGTGYTCQDYTLTLTGPATLSLTGNITSSFNVVGPHSSIFTKTSALSISGAVRAESGIAFLAPSILIASTGSIAAPALQLIATPQPEDLALIEKTRQGFTSPGQTWSHRDLKADSSQENTVINLGSLGSSGGSGGSLVIVAPRASDSEHVVFNGGSIHAATAYLSAPHDPLSRPSSLPTTGVQNYHPDRPAKHGKLAVGSTIVLNGTSYSATDPALLRLLGSTSTAGTGNPPAPAPSPALQGLSTTAIPATVVLPNIAASGTHLNAVKRSEPTPTASPSLAAAPTTRAPQASQKSKAKPKLLRASFFGQTLSPVP